jgi:hypothetical protein
LIDDLRFVGQCWPLVLVITIMVESGTVRLNGKISGEINNIFVNCLKKEL